MKILTRKAEFTLIEFIAWMSYFFMFGYVVAL